MGNRVTRSLLSVGTATAIAVVLLAGAKISGQGATVGGSSMAQGQFPRLKDGKPNLNGIWQTMNTANWDLEAQGGSPAPKEAFEMGASGAIPPGEGVVEGGRIPYTPEARKKRDENRKNWVALDTETHCYLTGIPRSTYLGYPFQIFQSESRLVFAYQYSYARRIVNMGKPIEAPVDQWMGWANGRWDGDTLVIDNTAFITPPEVHKGQPLVGNWLDRTGNFYTEKLHAVERYTPIDATHIWYEVTLEDPSIYTRPWKISMPLYKRIEKTAQILEFKCPEYVEELYWGKYKKQPTK
jgi:hypothetical protein